jgi:hypothetical protein
MDRDGGDGGWRDLVTGSFQTHVVPGAHHTLFNPDTIGPLRARLFEIVGSSQDLP